MTFTFAFAAVAERVRGAVGSLPTIVAETIAEGARVAPEKNSTLRLVLFGSVARRI